MSDDQKRILGSIAFVIVTILLAFLLYLFFFAPEQAPEEVVDDVEVTAGTVAGTLGTSDVRTGGVTVTEEPEPEEPELPPEPVYDPLSDVSRLASMFAERYGSFSTLTDYENLEDLKVFMTSGMQTEVDAFLEDARAQGPAVIFLGVTTRSLIVDVGDIDETSTDATATVTTQRTERTGGSNRARVYYQDLELTFERVDDTWKVDSATWDEEQQER